jgi:hypothetical protein
METESTFQNIAANTKTGLLDNYEKHNNSVLGSAYMRSGRRIV